MDQQHYTKWILLIFQIAMSSREQSDVQSSSGHVNIIDQVNVPRTYDPDGLRRRGACLCFKDKTEKEVKC